MDDLPTLKPDDEHKHVKTMRAVLFARGYEPENVHVDDVRPGRRRPGRAGRRVQEGEELRGRAVWDKACRVAAFS